MKHKPSVRKILQALYYIQNKAPTDNQSRFNRVWLLKMMYFADRYHIRNFGILATDDTYFAMNLGPVASTTFDILKNNHSNTNLPETAVVEFSEHDVRIMPQTEERLSESFKESIDFALNTFGSYSWSKLSDISHKYPEWKKHQTTLEINGRACMDLADFFDDPEDEANDPFKEDKEFLGLLKEDYESNYISD